MLFLAFSRLGCIIYSKEQRNRRMPPPDSPKPAYTGSTSAVSASAAAAAAKSEGAANDYAAWIGGRPSASSSSKMHSSSNREIEKAAGGGGGGGGNVGKSSASSSSSAAKSHRHQYSDLFGPRRELSRRRSSSFQDAKSKVAAQNQRGQLVSSRSAGNAGIAPIHQSSQDPALSKTAPPPPSAFPQPAVTAAQLSVVAAPRPPISRSNSTALPQCSPIEGNSAAAADTSNSPQNARKKSGMEVFQSGSLWDRGAVSSPMTSRRKKEASTPTTPTVTGHPTPDQPFDGPLRRSSRNNGNTNNAGRDQFEDALSRALTDKLDDGYGSPPPTQKLLAISRSSSYCSPEGGRNSMLMAVKTWTCVCTFENSVGQTACLGCGRVAPISRPTTPGRKRLPPHRRNSRIDTPPEVDL